MNESVTLKKFLYFHVYFFWFVFVNRQVTILKVLKLCNEKKFPDFLMILFLFSFSLTIPGFSRCMGTLWKQITKQQTYCTKGFFDVSFLDHETGTVSDDHPLQVIRHGFLINLEQKFLLEYISKHHGFADWPVQN